MLSTRTGLGRTPALPGVIPILAYNSFIDDERAITDPNSVWHAYARRAPCDIRTADVAELLRVLASPGAEPIKYWLWLEGPSIPALWSKIALPTSEDWFRSHLTGRSALFLSEDGSSVIAARWVGDERWAFVASREADVWIRDSSPRLGATGTVFIKTFSAEGAILSAKAVVQ